GRFERGELVSCVDESGVEIARGLVNYGSADAQLIAGRSSSDFEEILGYSDESEMIHRDNLVMI
ncbi:MAG: PUA domain-containing protein, partial [Methylobacter sp.]